MLNELMNEGSGYAVKAIKTSKPIFHIFRSASSRRLFAVHLTDNKENSLGVLKDSLTFDEAQECMLQYQQITNVVEVEDATEIESESEPV